VLRSAYRPTEQRTLDLDGDGRSERLVLVGATDSDGAVRPAGLLVCHIAARAGSKAVTVVAAMPLGLSSAYDVTFANEHTDLDGDGTSEIALDERVGGSGPHLSATTWFRLTGGSLAVVYHLARRYEYRGRTERRSLVKASKGELVERVSVVETDEKGQPDELISQEVFMRWDPLSGTFARVRSRVLR